MEVNTYYQSCPDLYQEGNANMNITASVADNEVQTAITYCPFFDTWIQKPSNFTSLSHHRTKYTECRPCLKRGAFVAQDKNINLTWVPRTRNQNTNPDLTRLMHYQCLPLSYSLKPLFAFFL